MENIREPGSDDAYKKSPIYEYHVERIQRLTHELDVTRGLFREAIGKNEKYVKEIEELKEQIACCGDQENRYIQKLKDERGKLREEVEQLKAEMREKSNVLKLEEIENERDRLLSENKHLEKELDFYRYRCEDLKNFLDASYSDNAELADTMIKSTDQFYEKFIMLQKENSELIDKLIEERERTEDMTNKFRNFCEKRRNGKTYEEIMKELKIRKSLCLKFQKKYDKEFGISGK